MRNREAIIRKLEGLESNLNKLNSYLNIANREACYEVLPHIREQIEQIKLYIESEPIVGSELNLN